MACNPHSFFTIKPAMFPHPLYRKNDCQPDPKAPFSSIGISTNKPKPFDN